MRQHQGGVRAVELRHLVELAGFEELAEGLYSFADEACQFLARVAAVPGELRHSNLPGDFAYLSPSVLHYLMTLLFGRFHFFWWRHCEFFARTCGSGSQALLKSRLVEEEQDHRGLLGRILHTYPVPVRNENRRSRSGVVLAASQCDPHCTFVDEYHFILVEMLVRRNYVSRWHFLRTDDERVRSSGDRIDLKDKRLLAQEHPSITFIGLKDRGRRLPDHWLRIGRCLGNIL